MKADYKCAEEGIAYHEVSGTRDNKGHDGVEDEPKPQSGVNMRL
jgi:hypothetical protein